MIKAIDIHKSFGGLEVLKGIDMKIKKGEIVTIVGSSGAGKTTLLQIIGTLLQAEKGKVFYDNVEVSQFREREMAHFRNTKIGFVFQFHHLLPEFTALENICIPAFIAKKPKEIAEQKALELLSFLNLADRAEHKAQ
jgi:lipoprotein-releasing system ATP-binding protein